MLAGVTYNLVQCEKQEDNDTISTKLPFTLFTGYYRRLTGHCSGGGERDECNPWLALQLTLSMD